MNLSLSLSFVGFWSYCTAHYPLILFFDILLLVKVKWNTGRSCFWRVLTQVRVFSLSSGICFSDEHWLRSTSLDTAAIEPNLTLASPGWRHPWSLYFWPVSLSSPLHSFSYLHCIVHLQPPSELPSSPYCEGDGWGSPCWCSDAGCLLNPSTIIPGLQTTISEGKQE